MMVSLDSPSSIKYFSVSHLLKDCLILFVFNLGHSLLSLNTSGRIFYYKFNSKQNP